LIIASIILISKYLNTDGFRMRKFYCGVDLDKWILWKEWSESQDERYLYIKRSKRSEHSKVWNASCSSLL